MISPASARRPLHPAGSTCVTLGRMSRLRLLALAALAALAIAVLAGCGSGGSSSSSSASTATTAAAAPFDQAFIDGMVPHHEGAIEMARAALDAGLTQQELVTIAEEVIATQQAEIDAMREWRDDWFGSADIDPDGADGLGLSESEMGMQHDASALADAMDVDAAFAAMMIDHHEGAIAMAELAGERSERQEIRDLAGRIIAAQQREIETMRRHAAGEHDGH